MRRVVTDLERIPDGCGLQLLVFQAARKAFDALQGRFKGGWGTVALNKT